MQLGQWFAEGMSCGGASLHGAAPCRHRAHRADGVQTPCAPCRHRAHRAVKFYGPEKNFQTKFFRKKIPKKILKNFFQENFFQKIFFQFFLEKNFFQKKFFKKNLKNKNFKKIFSKKKFWIFFSWPSRLAGTPAYIVKRLQAWRIKVGAYRSLVRHARRYHPCPRDSLLPNMETAVHGAHGAHGARTVRTVRHRAVWHPQGSTFFE